MMLVAEGKCELIKSTAHSWSGVTWQLLGHEECLLFPTQLTSTEPLSFNGAEPPKLVVGMTPPPPPPKLVVGLNPLKLVVGLNPLKLIGGKDS